MLSSHKNCPICQAPLIEMINRANTIISSCKQDITFHSFGQVSSLERNLMVETIHFPQEEISIEVNYELNSTKMVYVKRPKWDSEKKKWQHSPPDFVELKDRIIELDYPKLKKTINKIKSLAIFL
jgi:hypothetical protein